MATRPVWLQFSTSVSMNSVGSTVVDLLAGHLDDLQQSSRIVVAIKGQASVEAVSNSVTPDLFEVAYGFMTGNSNLVAADFPVLTVDGVINPGWMYRYHQAGVTVGDGTSPIQTYNHVNEFDVRSKRSLQGVGLQTLWLFVRTNIAVNAGSIFFNGQILLASKG